MDIPAVRAHLGPLDFWGRDVGGIEISASVRIRDVGLSGIKVSSVAVGCRVRGDQISGTTDASLRYHGAPWYVVKFLRQPSADFNTEVKPEWLPPRGSPNADILACSSPLAGLVSRAEHETYKLIT